MSTTQDTTPELTPTTETPQEPAAATPETPKPAPPAARKPGNRSLEDLLADVDAATRDAIIGEVRTARNEAKNLRTRAQSADEAARNDLAQTIGKALGLVADEPVDPAKLTEQLTATQKQAKQAALELAIFKSTPDADAAKALLDSRSFLAKVADIDPTDEIAIAAAVGEAVTANPALGKRLPAPNPAQGSSGGGPTAVSQLSEADLKNMSPEQIVAAQNEGRLNNLLGRR